MNLVSFVEGPFLRIAFALLFLGTLTRLTLLISGAVARAREQDARWRTALLPLGRSFFPFHRAVKKRPLYALVRYLHHGCMFVVPVYLWGHVVLWEESRFELSWSTLPDVWADRLTVIFIFLTSLFSLQASRHGRGSPCIQPLGLCTSRSGCPALPVRVLPRSWNLQRLRFPRREDVDDPCDLRGNDDDCRRRPHRQKSLSNEEVHGLRRLCIELSHMGPHL